jgi:HPt (histidine-containing phosphotransfer) domain-containing protein
MHGDLPSWRRVAHKFRGSCATLGARGMMELTRQMEALDEARMSTEGPAPAVC